MFERNLETGPARKPCSAKLAAKFLVIATLLSAACSEPTAPPVDVSPLFHRSGGGESGATSNFAVLANQAVTCTDGSITGSVGTFQAAPSGSVTQTGCAISGDVSVGNGAAQQAFDSFLGTYDALAAVACDTVLTGTLAGVTLAPGVYCFDAAATLTGALTLDGPSNGSWLFKIGTGGTGALTGTSFSVVMNSGAQACNVTWWVAQAATMTDSRFRGRILAGAAITLTRGLFNGNAWSKADVTITGTAVTGCATPQPPICEVSDRVTSGGWIQGPSGGKATFSVEARRDRRGQVQGHLTYHDHGHRGSRDDLRLRDTRVTAYAVVNPLTRRIEGTAKINGQGRVTYQVDVTDNGRGRNDTFSLVLSNGYSASGSLRGGNIQLHRSARGACGGRGHDQDDDEGQDDDENDDDDDHGNNGNNGNNGGSPLGEAGDFAILANQAVTCTDGTISGAVGTFLAAASAPPGSVTQTSCPTTGPIRVGDVTAIRAYDEFLSAYAAFAPRPADVCPIITGTLAGLSLPPGVYCVSAEAKTGVLTLTGPAAGTWVFRVAPGAFTGTNFSVVMAGGAEPCNVTWWVDAATTMTDSNLRGTVLSGAGVTLTRGTLIGRAFARADVTVTGTAVTGCASGSTGNDHDPD